MPGAGSGEIIRVLGAHAVTQGRIAELTGIGQGGSVCGRAAGGRPGRPRRSRLLLTGWGCRRRRGRRSASRPGPARRSGPSRGRSQGEATRRLPCGRTRRGCRRPRRGGSPDSLADLRGLCWERDPRAPFGILIQILTTYLHPGADQFESLRWRARGQGDDGMRVFEAELRAAVTDPGQVPGAWLSRLVRYEDGSAGAFRSCGACGAT